MSPPKEKGTLQHAPLLSKLAQTGYALALSLQARCEIRWREEAKRILAEYSRTGNPAHLKAFRVHRAAMGRRMRGSAVIR